MAKKSNKVICFGEIRDLIAKTDCISIMLTSIGDVWDNYLSIYHVPKEFDRLPIIGCGSVSGMYIDDDLPCMRGTEFYLYDGPYIEWDPADDPASHDPYTPEDRQKYIDEYIKNGGKNREEVI